jgi:hypothetical protein
MPGAKRLVTDPGRASPRYRVLMLSKDTARSTESEPLAPCEADVDDRLDRAERHELVVRCLIMVGVAGDVLTDFAARHRESVSATATSRKALAQLVAHCDQLARASAGLDSWERREEFARQWDLDGLPEIGPAAAATTDATPRGDESPHHSAHGRPDTR